MRKNPKKVTMVRKSLDANVYHILKFSKKLIPASPLRIKKNITFKTKYTKKKSSDAMGTFVSFSLSIDYLPKYASRHCSLPRQSCQIVGSQIGLVSAQTSFQIRCVAA